MLDLLKHFIVERLGKPLDEKLRENKAYWKSRKQYNIQMEELKKKLGKDEDGVQFALKLDETVGEYSSHYGESTYILGLHDGIELGLKHSREAVLIKRSLNELVSMINRS